MTEAQARNALDMAGFGVDVSYQENDSVTEGTVISWNPSGKQKPGATITVVIAKKSGKASVPGNLYGKSISAAVTALNNAGFYNIAFCDQNGNPVSGNENATVTGVSPHRQTVHRQHDYADGCTFWLGFGFRHEHGRRFRYDQLVATQPLITLSPQTYSLTGALAPPASGRFVFDMA